MYSFDLRESILSFALLQITNLFKKIKPGEVIKVIGNEQKVIKDIKRVLPGYNYEISINEIEDNKEKVFCLKLIKKN
ncbi:TusA-like domain-containing protein [Desulfonema limicola]|uniref:TusA-like domain-containing protein n=1 Tax=Desulfonema limicola TaxID=45656 RepID=A0A975BC29_9BACT|nr:hypothetical protein [Desulfonema limicola]QTA82578.1 TusA-like domain-containing protein [Desulfonema limicola]